MTVDRQAPASPRAYMSLSPRGLFAGGTTGNERLTGATGGVLIAPLAIIGVTIIQPRLSAHH